MPSNEILIVHYGAARDNTIVKRRRSGGGGRAESEPQPLEDKRAIRDSSLVMILYARSYIFRFIACIIAHWYHILYPYIKGKDLDG